MTREEQIESIISDLVKSGSDISYIFDLSKKSKEVLKKDIGLIEVLEQISKDIKAQTEAFLSEKNIFNTNFITGISTCIYFPDFKGNGEVKLKLIGGYRSRNLDLIVNDRTLFDVASITKLFTLLLAFKLEEEGLLDLNVKVKDINPNFQNLGDFTLNDLILLHGELWTNGNIRNAKTREEAYDILKTLYLKSNSREENKYTDFGAIVIGDTIEEVFRKHGIEASFSDIMRKYLLEPLGLDDTTFNPKNDIVHDPKSRILGGAVGSAGIFTTSEDLARLAKGLYSVTYINKEHLSRLGKITFPNSNQSQKGNLGTYVKHPLGYSKTYVPPEFSTGSFASQGWTGPVASFDPNNLIHHNILINAIYDTENKEVIKNDKPVGFSDAFEEYQAAVMRNIMLMYVAKQFYNKFCKIQDDFSKTIALK